MLVFPSSFPFSVHLMYSLSLFGFPVSISIGHNEVIGMCRVGSDAEGPGREHWTAMLANPRKPIEHWHQLVEVLPFSFSLYVCAYLRFCTPIWFGAFSVSAVAFLILTLVITIAFSLARKNPLTRMCRRTQQPRQNRTSWWTVLTPTRHVGTDIQTHKGTHAWLIRHLCKL